MPVDAPELLGADGRPLTREEPMDGATAKALQAYVSTFVSALTNARLPVERRARDPFGAHVWVFAAAAMTSTVAGQAPFTVYREKPEVTGQRVARAKANGSPWQGPRSGLARRAVQRHLAGGVSLKRLSMKAAEPDYDHPAMELMLRPNPLQSGVQLQQVTDLWLILEGEAFWVMTDDEGNPPAAGQAPTRIWPIPPRCFVPMHENGRFGEVIGWWYQPPSWMPNATAGNVKIPLGLSEVLHFKTANPSNSVRGLSRLYGAADSVATDLDARAHNRSLVRNNSVPKGAFTTDAPIDLKQLKEFLTNWEQQHKGPDNSGRIGLLTHGVKYQAFGLSPEKLEYLGQLQWHRDEILAAMNVPPSLLGQTEYTNYATQLGQNRNFWELTVLPMLRLKESTIDGSPLFFGETDNVFGAYDLSGIEALRAGIEEKAVTAERLCGETLHMPPSAAYEVVGLDAPEYVGDDVAFVGPMVRPVADALEGPPPAPAPAPAEPAKSMAPAGRVRMSAKARATKNKNRWAAFIQVQAPHEAAMRKAYRRWVAEQRRQTLERFDQAAGLKAEIIDLVAVLPDPDEGGNRLGEFVRPTFTKATEDIYGFTLDDIGIATFEVDDTRIQDFWRTRERVFKRTIPTTARTNLFNALTEGVSAGETVQQLRQRVGQVYDVAGSHFKTLQVARTETAGLMNGVRDTMFEAQGFQLHEWVSAGDEATRSDHRAFDGIGAKPRGFNFLEVVAGSGVLRHPGDPDGPAGQVINCRCLAVPATEDEE